MTIEILPDDVLLAIFTSYLLGRVYRVDMWRTLVHVCQRWRYLVFASPGHLNLRLECTIKTRAREMLGVWPALPIVITDDSDSMESVDDIIAALEQRDRVCQITLEDIPRWKMGVFVPAMLGPFPALQGITFEASDVDSSIVVVPDSFLGGSAPQLEWFTFHGFPFPALPTLLSSTTNLDDLQLTGILRSGYISPEVMVTCLSAMPRLSTFRFQFHSPESFPNRECRQRPPLARATLPALRDLFFGGVNEYFEDLITRIDTPVIHVLETTYFHQHIYDFSQLSQFIGRVEAFKLPAYVNIRLLNGAAEVSVSSQITTNKPARLLLGISCAELHLQLRYFVQVCSSSLLPFSDAESLAISSVYRLQRSQWEPTLDDFLWLDLLYTFSVVKNLNIDKNILTLVAYTLKDVVKERITGVFPAIQELSVGEHLPSGPVLRAIEKFATARGLFTRLDRPHRWVAG